VRQPISRDAAKRGGGAPFHLLFQQLFWSALVGAQIGWLEALGLEHAGVVLSAREDL
jgi:hypothetical protein